jgi:hypothetical protein
MPNNDKVKVELEILVDGEAPISNEGNPIHNIIEIPFEDIENKNGIRKYALKYLHYFESSKINKNSTIKGVLWIKNLPKLTKPLRMGAYEKKNNRYVWNAA